MQARRRAEWYWSRSIHSKHCNCRKSTNCSELCDPRCERKYCSSLSHNVFTTRRSWMGFAFG